MFNYKKTIILGLFYLTTILAYVFDSLDEQDYGNCDFTEGHLCQWNATGLQFQTYHLTTGGIAKGIFTTMNSKDTSSAKSFSLASPILATTSKACQIKLGMF